MVFLWRSCGSATALLACDECSVCALPAHANAEDAEQASGAAEGTTTRKTERTAERPAEGLGAMTFRYDLVDLRLFLNAVESGSITAGAAATQLGLATASARILAMEDSLGVPLLKREARGVQPTAAGQALVLHARTLLLQMERLQGGLAEHSPGIKLQMRLLCSTVAMHEVVPERLADFLLAHPHVNVQVEERPGNDVVNALAEGTADVGIVRENTDVFELESFLFQQDRLVLVAAPSHPLAAAAQDGAISLTQADLCDVVGLHKGTALQDLWDRRVAQRGRHLNYRIRVGSFDEQCRLVARGAGIALMPRSTAERQARLQHVCIVPLTEDFADLALRLCVRRLAELPAATRRLVDSLLGSVAPEALPSPVVKAPTRQSAASPRT
jgi:DNA-binding transcriptional LysR family regulator